MYVHTSVIKAVISPAQLLEEEEKTKKREIGQPFFPSPPPLSHLAKFGVGRPTEPLGSACWAHQTELILLGFHGPLTLCSFPYLLVKSAAAKQNPNDLPTTINPQ